MDLFAWTPKGFQKLECKRGALERLDELPGVDINIETLKGELLNYSWAIPRLSMTLPKGYEFVTVDGNNNNKNDDDDDNNQWRSQPKSVGHAIIGIEIDFYRLGSKPTVKPLCRGLWEIHNLLQYNKVHEAFFKNLILGCPKVLSKFSNFFTILSPKFKRLPAAKTPC